jgi:integrase
MGSLYKRGNVWWLKYRQHGRVVRESSSTTKESVARRMLRVREGDVERGIPIEPKIGRVSFEDAVDDLFNDYRTNGRKTLDDLERRVTMHLTPFFRGKLMTAITTTDVRAYIAKRQKDTVRVRKARREQDAAGMWREIPEERRPVSPGEINRELTALKRAFSVAIEAGKLRHKPHIPMLLENNVRTGFFEAEQYRAVLKHLPPAIRPIVTFAYVTGWRLASEILPLEWRQVDREAGEVRLDPGTTKNGEGRVIHLPLELKVILAAQWLEHEALRKAGRIVPVVFHRNGKPIKSIRRVWQNACRAAGCPGRIPHDLRRTAVRNMVRCGIPEAVAMKISGHKTRSVFERYNVTSDGDLRAAATRLGGEVLSMEQSAKKKRGHNLGHTRASARVLADQQAQIS